MHVLGSHSKIVDYASTESLSIVWMIQRNFDRKKLFQLLRFCKIYLSIIWISSFSILLSSEKKELIKLRIATGFQFLYNEIKRLKHKIEKI